MCLILCMCVHQMNITNVIGCVKSCLVHASDSGYVPQCVVGLKLKTFVLLLLYYVIRKISA